MLKHFQDYLQASKFAREFARENNTSVTVARFNSEYYIAASVAHHPIGMRGATFMNCGWRKDNYHLSSDEFSNGDWPEKESLGKELESWVNTVVCNTTGFTLEQCIAIAENIVKYKICVWHEVSRFVGDLDSCQCAKCANARNEKQ